MATSAETDVRVLASKGMQHDWPLTLSWLDESRLAWNAMRRSWRNHNAERPTDKASKPNEFTSEQLNDIAQRHGVRFK